MRRFKHGALVASATLVVVGLGLGSAESGSVCSLTGGFIDGGYGVLVLDGEVTVNTRRGQVTLQKGQGTMIYGNKAPNKAAPWPDQRVKAAVATITFK